MKKMKMKKRKRRIERKRMTETAGLKEKWDEKA